MNFMMHIKEAFANLLSSKLRSFLAILGILVGTGSVVAMVSGGQLATQHALEQFESLGTDLLAVSLFSQHKSEGSGQKSEFTLDDAKVVEARVPSIEALAPYATVYTQVALEGHKVNGNVIGSTESLQTVINIDMQQGRFISAFDGTAPFCVLGQQIYQNLKNSGIVDPIGSQIQLGSEMFTIIGVMAQWPENAFFNQDVNTALVIPVETAKRISSYAQINNLVMQLYPDSNIDKTQNAIREIIERELPDYKLFFRSAKQLLESMTGQQQTLTLLLALIGSISLLVGGIGVMNIMLVSVVERRREIGIRMAVGARRRDIQFLFLIEAVTLTLFGGLLGVGLGILTSFAIAFFAKWHFSVFWLPPAIGFAVSVAIGVFFGFYPAYQASRLDPITTLRSE